MIVCCRKEKCANNNERVPVWCLGVATTDKRKQTTHTLQIIMVATKPRNIWWSLRVNLAE